MYHNKNMLWAMIATVLISLTHGTTIYPNTLNTQAGSASDVSLTALRKKDLSGNQDSWSKYVEFYGSNSAYTGVFSFDVSSVDAASVSEYTLDVNFRGPKRSEQHWNFEFYSSESDSWVAAGDNSDASDWSWTSLSFNGEQEFSSIVNDGVVKIRLSSTVGDDCDLDYLALSTTEGSAATSAPTSKATTAPTAAATSAPTKKPTSAPTAASTTAPTKKPTSAPTTKPTAAPTEKATAAPTPKATAAPTEKATAAPTPKATAAPTPKATAAPTSKPTTKPTPAPTPKATAAPTTKPTTKPTPAPTPKATAAPTPKATSAPTTAPAGGRVCPAGQVWAPAPGTTWQWQLTGTIDQSLDVQMYDIDLFDSSADVIASLHSAGRVVICYFSTQYENWRPDAADFTSAVLGNNLDDWPGERYVDITSSVVRNIMTARLDLAVSKGCDGVEPDNVDSYENSNGLGITAADQLDYNRFFASEGHARGLSVGLKNDIDQASTLQANFDWALNEQCNEYDECDSLTSFVTAGKAVFGVEYSGSVSSFCPKMVSDKFSWLLKDLDLDASVTPCCTYAAGGCAAKASYRCITYASKRSENGEEEVYEPVEVENTPSLHSSASSTFCSVAALFVAVAFALVL